ncbi:MAG: glutamine--fructose-6-phosphate transaminase (isomerizing) [Candidatus Marinimicrobia bacterium]|nr:glutamine--fructose-6-phosphate transaminase (isomerizing) [Candidatus Neomarinimicrobiota bacterium]
MCGIIGYVGKRKDAVNLALKGLRCLEYRGYDSAGIVALPVNGKSFFLQKASGPVQNLSQKISQLSTLSVDSCCAIGHTRWATHGIPSEKNAHPHCDCKKKIFVVHNGIIENYQYLKEVLQREGHIFYSDTDTEVISHLIERQMIKGTLLEDAVSQAVYYLKGTFAIAVMHTDEPNKIVAVRRSSPLIIGIADGYFISSDVSAIVEHTKKIIYMEDNEIAVLSPESFSFFSTKTKSTLDGDLKIKNKKRKIDTVDWDIEESQKGNFPHFMLKEIHEQPDAIKNSLRGRLLEKDGKVKLGGLEVLNGKVKDINRIVIVACGTAYYAGLVGKYMIESCADIPVEVELASEFTARSQILQKDTAVLAISQSGETADTLNAIKQAQKNKNLTLGIINTVGSSIARQTDAGVYNHIGPEIGVASTKAFTSQLVILALYALFFANEKKSLSKEKVRKIIKDLYLLPVQIKKILDQSNTIKQLAKKYSKYENFLFIGRDYNYPIALEGALKLKEVSYIHAEGYASGEMKHGPISLIDKNFPTMAILGNSNSKSSKKTASNIEEIKTRKGPVIAVVATQNKNEFSRFMGDTIYVPKTSEILSPILSVIPLQLFAYHMAVIKGHNPDKPRNLAKSVTVE